jgi:hypothetical protein
MIDDAVFALGLSSFFVMGILLVKYPIAMVRDMLTARQWRMIEDEDEASIAEVARVIGVAFIGMVVFTLLGLLMSAR